MNIPLSLIWQIINFLLLLYILYRVLSQPTKNYLGQRRHRIQSSLEESYRAKKEAEESYKEYERKLSLMEKELEEIRESFRKEGEREKNRLIEGAEKEARMIREQAELFISQELKKARASLKEEMINLAIKLAEEIIRRELSKKDQRRLLEEFILNLDKLEKRN